MKWVAFLHWNWQAEMEPLELQRCEERSREELVPRLRWVGCGVEWRREKVSSESSRKWSWRSSGQGRPSPVGLTTDPGCYSEGNRNH